MGDEITRALATIQKVASLTPIDGADRIEVAAIQGWQVIVQKGLHEVGDLVLFCEIDSFLPVNADFEWLRKSSFKSTKNLGDGFRVKTMKMRGVVSQGIVIPLTKKLGGIIVEGRDTEIEGDYWPNTIAVEGANYTEALGIQKYEKPIPSNLVGKVRGNFPSFIHKTDQERVENVIKYVNGKWFDQEWEMTLKLDGQSMTAYVNNDTFGVCSRNLDLLQEEGNTLWDMAIAHGLEEKIRSLGGNYAIQMELIGPGVNGNWDGLTEHQIAVFDIFDIDKQEYIAAYYRLEICENLDIPHAPFLGYVRFPENVDVAYFREQYANRPSIKNPIAEGVVFKSLNNPSLSFKCINPEFLIKSEKE